MSFLFGSKKQSTKEIVRDEQRALRKNERGIEREQRELQTREQKIIIDIKKAGKNRTALVKGQLQAVSSQLNVAKTQETLVTSLGGAAKAVGMANKQMDPAAINKIINQFAEENDKMSSKQELMDDTFDDIFDEEGVGEEADDVTAQVLAEIGLELKGKMAVAPRSAVVAQPVAEEPVAAQDEDEDSALMRRLQALK